MVRVLVFEVAIGVDLEAVDLRAAARIAVPDHDHTVARDKHLVIPVTTRVHAGREGVDGVDGLKPAIARRDGEETSAAQDDEDVALHLHDAAFVDTGFLVIGDAVSRLRRGGICRSGFGGSHGGRRGWRRPARARLAGRRLGLALLEELDQFALGGKGLERLLGRIGPVARRTFGRGRRRAGKRNGKSRRDECEGSRAAQLGKWHGSFSLRS